MQTRPAATAWAPGVVVVALWFACANAVPRAADTGSISGRVLDEANRPVAGATVRLSRDEPGGLSPAVSDDRGAFAFSELPPGRFTIIASKSGFFSVEYGAERPRQLGVPLVLAAAGARRDVTLRVLRGAVVSGVVREPDGSPARGVTVTILENRIDTNGERTLVQVGSATTDGDGRYRAAAVPMGTVLVRATSPAETGARPVDLEPAAERDGIDITLATVRTSRIEGRIVDASGGTPRHVWLDRSDQSSGGSVATAVLSGNAFAFSGVTPGSYVLRGSGGVSTSSGQQLEAAEPLVVDGSDVLGLTLILQPPATLTGRVVFDTRVRPSGSTPFRVSLVPASVPGLPRGLGAGGIVESDGTFAIAGILPGTYRFWTAPWVIFLLDSPWSMRSVEVGGHDVTDQSISISRGQTIADVVVTITDQFGGVTGTVTDAAGRPTTRPTVVVFPADAGLWPAHERRIAAARPADDGSFVIRRLASGDYRAALIEHPEPNEWLLPSTLQKLVPLSVPFKVAEGSLTQRNLTAK